VEGVPAHSRGVEMTFKGPFLPKPFCDFMTLCPCKLVLLWPRLLRTGISKTTFVTREAWEEKKATLSSVNLLA